MATEPQKSSVEHGRGRSWVANQIAGVVLVPVDIVRGILPEKGLPVYLGLGALAVVDVISLPAATVAGVGYFVLKRW